MPYTFYAKHSAIPYAFNPNKAQVLVSLLASKFDDFSKKKVENRVLQAAGGAAAAVVNIGVISFVVGAIAYVAAVVPAVGLSAVAETAAVTAGVDMLGGVAILAAAVVASVSVLAGTPVAIVANRRVSSHVHVINSTPFKFRIISHKFDTGFLRTSGHLADGNTFEDIPQTVDGNVQMTSTLLLNRNGTATGVTVEIVYEIMRGNTSTGKYLVCLLDNVFDRNIYDPAIAIGVVNKEPKRGAFLPRFFENTLGSDFAAARFVTGGVNKACPANLGKTVDGVPLCLSASMTEARKQNAIFCVAAKE